jgi:hypothetical protein
MTAGPTGEPCAQLLAVEGEEFEVSADDVVSGGYRWVAQVVPDGLTLLGDDAMSARRTFRLRADEAGDHELRLALVRPWEPPEVPPAAERQVRVHVDPPATSP